MITYLAAEFPDLSFDFYFEETLTTKIIVKPLKISKIHSLDFPASNVAHKFDPATIKDGTLR
jgi:hypothetical protein